MQVADVVRRAERDALVHELRAEGWSLRRIGAHPAVRLSAPMVSKVLAAPVSELAGDDELGRYRLRHAEGPAGDRERARLRKLCKNV